ncbi:2-oxo acid dehydrogenase subunit E2 [Arthrobacter bambusae]|uniref:Pyruvate/2-oxoglutarate dehydrogenase complex dihydrolipoamide acyltransferase (E2) component n=1 Tax=Arthrobacter bambusae TaxID=1338426 RepID=A0AAW8DJ97_9MICC|nr:2-oxo acid dehydrogenase subunit E2 [Arthrobacter bambusae]MDP9906032.1 pyruvate/2-oxoglutarate dehydrogenase complex dihydrolipoamide acyltransferase (E2) component [Arthrobacter bambusae]MDQ0131173.1 pyruvate/2-oxoglutarate dehydrogenase complex dihydrolipoamide acyltransferase (E2) component [Arthrobacter bambusae]MDQ0181835.1 pyruvate/2-oxoglutarate dehydrogenase complex dihydrolipoamide acyltransferase (E2) component [Arthrobacter bambusae]
MAEPNSSSTPGERRVRISGIRKIIADRMALSHTQIPGVHVVEECDLTNVDLSKIVAITSASIGLLAAKYPYFNAHVIESEIVCFDECNVAIAVDTPRGLMVPVIRNVGNLDLKEIDAEVRRLAILAREGRLTSADITGATITLTSPGKRGGVLATPLISHPQTAIVGVHRAVPRAVIRSGEMVIRTISNVTVTFDHRVIDGATAGDYTIELCRLLESSAQI